MRGGRLTIRNEGRYPTAEVERLVRFGLQEIELTGAGIVAVVKDTRRTLGDWPTYSGTAYRLSGGIPCGLYDRHMKGRRVEHLIVMRLGPPECFPIRPFVRNGRSFDYATWQEALVGITAHEGKHAQHHHDGSYRTRSGIRAPATYLDPQSGRRVPFRRGGRVRIGAERIEPKCEAFELNMTRRFRAEVAR